MFLDPIAGPATNPHPTIVHSKQIRKAFRSAYEDVARNHTSQMAAALSYYFVISLFPAVIFLFGVLAYVPIPNLFDQGVHLIGQFLPAEEMGLVKRLLAGLLSSHRGAFLSFGLLGTVWTASGGFAAMIEALNIAYDVKETRPFWKTRPLAVALALLLPFLLTALVVMIVGPGFGEFLTAQFHVSQVFSAVWPFLRWAIAIGFTVLAVEGIYFWAPNVKQRFWWTLPGALLSVSFWLLLSCLLGLYFRKFAHLNNTYGVFGAVIGLMIWLYWTGFAMLVGAELNGEFAKLSQASDVTQSQT